MSRHLLDSEIGVTVQGIYGPSDSLYLENTEWTTSSGAATFDFASANDPHTGAVSIETTADMGASNYISFDKGADINPSYGVLKLWFKLKVAMNLASGQLELQWYNGGSPVGNKITLFGGPGSIYGLSGGNTTTYQEGEIPIADFLLDGPVDELRIESPIGPSTREFFLDDVTIEGATDPNAKWYPIALTLGDFTPAGAFTFAAAGSGILYTFNNNADDELIGNVALDRNGIAYDGSEIMLELHWQIFTASGGGDNVLWELDYVFISDGDDNYADVGGTVSLDVDVSARTEREQYSDRLPAISGVAGAKVLQLTLRRNGSGAGSDSYGGDADVYGIDLRV